MQQVRKILMKKPRIRAGDTVRHLPTNQFWEVAAVGPNGYSFYASGWPETFEFTARVQLVEQCSDEEHWKIVEKWASKVPGHDDWCPRHSINFALWDSRLRSDCDQMMRL